MTTPASPKKTADSWKTARRHKITLQSGFQVEIEIPNLPSLVKTGQLPNELVTEALKTISDGPGSLTPELIATQADFYDKLVAITVKVPEITEADVKDLPYEDVELIVEIATRQRDLDAVGHHVGGLHTSKDWLAFRGLEHLHPDVAGL